ncbi:hypothetical protein HDU96_009730 [Phlyctochytrium bullatum]|nr:hypothetical protein HDU96_009730 [Phlyctochytrium bullatum]
MDSLLSNPIPVITAATAGAVIAAAVWFGVSRSASDNRWRCMPGPRKGYGFPFGFLNELQKYVERDAIHMLFADMHAKYGKYVYVWTPIADFTMIADAEVLRTLGTDSELVKRGTVFQDVAEGVFSNALFVLPTGPNDKKWKPHRKAISMAFTPVHLKYGFEKCDEIVNRLCEGITDQLTAPGSSGKVTLELRKFFTLLTVDIIGYMIFSKDIGISVTKDPDLLNVMDKLLQVTNLCTRRTGVPRLFWKSAGVGVDKAHELRKPITDLIEQYLDEKRASPRKDKSERRDIGDIVLQQFEAGEFDRNDILDELVGLFFAGHDTTAITLTGMVYHFCKNPEVAQKLIDEIDYLAGKDDVSYERLNDFKYLDAFLKETLRFEPIASVLTRVALKNLQVGPYRIPKHSHIYLNVLEPMMSTEYWGEDAHDFKPDRWLVEGFNPVPGSYNPFGMGAQMCIGMKLANIEAKLVMIRLLQRFRLQLPEGFVPEKIFYITLGYKAVEVEVTLR